MQQFNKFFLLAAFIFLGLGLLLILQTQSTGKLRLIFCDVGQGDGMLLISPEGHQVVVDAGAGAKIQDCLSRYMPFWDRIIELIVPTHPHQEHAEGFIDILNRYQVKSVLTTNVPNDALFYKQLETSIANEHATVHEPDRFDTILLDPSRGPSSAKLEVLWPFRENLQGKPSIEYWKKNPPSDLNETSIVLLVTYGDFCAYLTGDLPKEILEPLIVRRCPVLKVVHHGSRTGTSDEVLTRINPKLAVIQVGKNNKFGHPHKEVLDLLSAHHIQILRNDLSGTIEVDSDGKGYSLKDER